ncbi:Inner membrane protein YiaA [BD1-7 clade bacterium]|uniref:Inner membrane protein YiaA n=1 Tax=BD1-7 clade bacterium TaxID=2029982 RepID=A0A5S9PJG6_9GAMM|nr:Inner membrane protein YiaA [BD1-7 clade bacterium]CAA0104337.1 Inner membrane protein YiaA [BD1-7 clade bacterium]
MLIINSIYFTALRYVVRATRLGLRITKGNEIKMLLDKSSINKPTAAYIGATWGALAIGVIGYLVGLWNAAMQLNEKGFYFAVFLLAMFSAVTLQKTVRDRDEGLPVTNIFLGMCWSAFASSVALLVIGLINADLFLSEKGFYGMAFVLSLFSIITVQKNIRDLTNENGETEPAAFSKPDGGIDVAANVVDIL